MAISLFMRLHRDSGAIPSEIVGSDANLEAPNPENRPIAACATSCRCLCLNKYHEKSMSNHESAKNVGNE